MLNVIRAIFSVIGIVLGGYGLVTQNFKFNPLMMFFLGASMLVSGLIELKRERESYGGYISIAVALFAFFVSIQAFLYN